MDNARRRKQWFWTGLILISVLYCLYYVLFLYRMALDMPIRGRHVVKFLFILLVYGVGVSCLRKWGAPWMLRVWHYCYLLIVLLLLLLGGYDWTIARTPASVRSIADSLQAFLISPILYVAMRILAPAQA
ncbi:MAG TPA: hypothetical protein VHD83_23465 [Puia sp.]|nr:hypothetical protein [Puia sp.]